MVARGRVSLVIFLAGFDTSNLAADATTSPRNPPHVGYFLAPTKAHADEPPTQEKIQSLNEKLAKERAENERLQRELQQSRQQALPAPPPPPPPSESTKNEQFFKRW